MYRDLKLTTETVNIGSRAFSLFSEDNLKKLSEIAEASILALVALNTVLISVAENLRFSIQQLMIWKNYKTVPKVNYKCMRWWVL